MPLTKTGNIHRPLFGGTPGGISMRNLPKDSFLVGSRTTCIYMKIPQRVVLGAAEDISSHTSGQMIWDDGTSGTAWSTAFPGVPCSVVFDKNSTAGGSATTVRITGYDQFDRLIEEEVTAPDGQAVALSKHAYRELVQCEIVGTSTVTGATIEVAGVSDHDDLSVDWSGTGANASCRVALPFIPKHPHVIRAVHLGGVAAAAAHGWLRWTSENTWQIQHENASMGDATALTDADVYGGDISNACILVPGFTTADDWGMLCIHLDPDLAYATL